MSTIPWRQRCFDLAFAIAALPVVAVAAGAIAVAIYIDSPGPVLYRSLRVGRGGELFEMLKFRKMRREAPSHPVTLTNDDRFTPIGRFLAGTRLDEIPQIVNVLRGHMRLVGPRPELPYFTEQYADEYAEILTVTPGITGNAQLRFLDEKALLSGLEPARIYSDEVLPAKIQVDLAYVRRHTLPGDLVIILRTILVPLSMLSQYLRRNGPMMRLWLPWAVSAALLGVVLVFASGRMP